MKQSTTSTKDEKLSGAYQNNPFYVATDGLDRLFKRAQPVAILLAIISVLSIVGPGPGSFGSGGNQSTGSDATKEGKDFASWISSIQTEVWITIGVVALLLVLVMVTFGIILKGINDFTASRLARGETVTLGEAFKGVFSQFWGYTWVLVIRGVKTFLWTLLFIVPGIIMSIKYSLAGVSFFDTGKKGNDAVKDSLALTKGAVLTTFGSQALFNIITLGLIAPLLEPGTNSVLYSQYRTLTDAGQPKPKSHVLSKVTLAILIGAILLGILLLVLLSFAFSNYSSTAP